MKHALYAFLDQHALTYQRFEHPPVYTCEEARQLCPDMPGAETKNLFLCDGKGTRHLLVVVPAEATVDLKALSQELDVKGLRFASPEWLQRYLGLEPGSVTLLAVLNDRAGAVDVVVDASLWQADAILCHPLVNTETLAVPRAELMRFLELTGHPPRVIPVPQRAA
ncbi:prolyl-tRNA synthetase associated domain-containing protein [Crenobacter sp. SG2305]|uniref:prolyl-tRNA synthetase associated domain-containing protein n=1 Tax=Crenobacter oryzisoli TaxID=3056844 RepID=UPI0025AAAF9B|nr:prolyl-tRNA synthetase associated domain-containing protein [Crenobacter sp. SG2305]MDN0085199.1 prolyl-tRNA synthetase associated domain-containing protein [Crenobacter sp. SG2305]